MALKPSPPPVRNPLPYLLTLFSLPLLACSLLNRITDSISRSDEMSLEEALAVAPVDSRPEVLEELGPPDSFLVEFQELEGQPVRWETWSYFDFDTRFDFIDGELLWTIDLEPVPEGSIYAHWYDPADFQAGMSLAEVNALLAGQELLQVDLAALDLEGGLILAGDQILLGFEDDHLVYVETLILSPDPAGAALAGPPAADDPAQPQAEEAGGTLSFLQDDFESPAALALPIFSDDSIMIYGNIDGQGALTTRYPDGVMLAYYPQLALEDFILQVEIHPLGFVQGAQAGVIFRAEDPAGGSDYYLNLSVVPSSQQIHLDGWKGGAWAVLESRDIPQDLVPASGVYDLQIDCQGDLIKVYLSGGLAAEFRTSLIQEPGYFGLSIISSRDQETATFDDLLITKHP